MTQDNPIPGRDAAVSLREVTYANLFEVLDLKIKPEQECLVAPNSVSISEAHFWPTGWFRAIYADDTPVGFVMITWRMKTERLNCEKRAWMTIICGVS